MLKWFFFKHVFDIILNFRAVNVIGNACFIKIFLESAYKEHQLSLIIDLNYEVCLKKKVHKNNNFYNPFEIDHMQNVWKRKSW